ncbi:disease resistance protein RPS6-like [Mangifera indica]|uniref:disease resistance protein RPS6-like n=1 Tax=Mangifera indica TaxID=29780 RepID=UPI001CFBA8D9|nr:disease resistance protein RPS6-like [Mangifera indica]XP_044481456.1 disease resistance protein RPS6-like [Mangifera indica]
MAASSSLTTRFEHDVYLSFRDEDVRHFIDRLNEALLDDKIKIFIDDKLVRGEETLHAIEKSKISVVVFSENYASSKSFLEELEKILGCRRLYGQVVIPVYYHVDPVDVKNQTGSFGHGFSRVEERYKENPERLTRWRDALKEAANISGFSADAIRPDDGLVEDIVEDILEKLPDISPEYEQVEEVKMPAVVGLSADFIVEADDLEGLRWSESELQGLRWSESESQGWWFESESHDLWSKYESQGWRFLSVFFLVMEAISVVLDEYGKSNKNFLLAAFVLSAFGFIITIYAFIRKRNTAAYKQRAERELAWVEVAFSVVQLVISFSQYILAVAKVKNSYSPSLFPLVFALVVVVFAFKKKQISHSQEQVLDP